MVVKYTKEYKLDCIKRYKRGEYVKTPKGCTNRHTFTTALSKWVRMYDSLGKDAFNKRSINIKEKIKMIEEVQSGLGYGTVAERHGLQSTIGLKNWIRIYEQEGINGLKLLEKGIKPFMSDKSKKKDYSKLSKKELEERVEYLEAENEYLKKLDALVQARKKQKTKKKLS